jgi:hypothetical protein
MSLPFVRAINPVTKTNREGVGTEPHLKVSQDRALATARALARPSPARKENERRSLRVVTCIDIR